MVTKAKSKNTRSKNAVTHQSKILSLLLVSDGKRRRGLRDDERQALILMLAHKSNALAFDIDALVPAGSFLRQIVGHFSGTDISYALPLFQLLMTSASWLTQNGAYLDVEGAGRILPTLWTVGLADSGSAKTFAADRVSNILSSAKGTPAVAQLPPVSTDAQWIVDLAENNGAFWFQDEVGKFVHAMNTSSTLARLKAWMLNAYSHAAIGNRLKGEAKKLVIERPHFTFHGLTVFDTWSKDVNVTTMLDGWCQRMNYYVAPPRRDSSLFDHFIYFGHSKVATKEKALRETWSALCSQPGAAGSYTLSPKARAYLDAWWKGLQKSWGDFALPASFLRRIGFSVLRYLMVLQFLLGKSRHPIDVETARLATAFAEFHMESALYLVQSYDQAAAGHVQKVLDVHASIKAEGEDPSPRNISRRLSKAARAAVSGPMVKEILTLLKRVDPPSSLVEKGHDEKAVADAIHCDWQREHERLKLSERKRNERRLRDLRKRYAASLAAGPEDGTDLDGVVIDFRAFAAFDSSADAAARPG